MLQVHFDQDGVSRRGSINLSGLATVSYRSKELVGVKWLCTDGVTSALRHRLGSRVSLEVSKKFVKIFLMETEIRSVDCWLIKWHADCKRAGITGYIKEFWSVRCGEREGITGTVARTISGHKTADVLIRKRCSILYVSDREVGIVWRLIRLKCFVA